MVGLRQDEGQAQASTPNGWVPDGNTMECAPSASCDHVNHHSCGHLAHERQCYKHADADNILHHLLLWVVNGAARFGAQIYIQYPLPAERTGKT